jgi:Di-sulfide bridge nucleocytoplasmic transport domain
LQFFFNLCLILLFLYVLIQLIVTVQGDVEQKISEQSMGAVLLFYHFPKAFHDPVTSSEIVQEITNCALMFRNNHCPGNIIPHMVQPCSEWEMCMNRDPTKVGRARIGAELMAEVLNGFVEPISWKTLVRHVTSTFFPTPLRVGVLANLLGLKN